MKKKSGSAFHGLAAVLLSSLAMIDLGSVSAHAQKNAPAGPPPTTSMQPKVTSKFDADKVLFDSNGKPITQQYAKAADCFLPPLSGLHIVTTSAADLQIPAKSQKEYEDGCAALRNKKITEAETHLRKAVKEYPKYPTAWVVLGQVLEAEQKTDEARNACSQPVTASPSYLPAYLCLADISARSKNWDDVLKLSSHALEIDPVTDAVAYSYNAAANFNLNNLPAAEKSALKALDIDKSNADPRVHFLLAQIYAAKGDGASEAAQLREYLKFATDPADIAMVKGYLTELDKQNGK
jgi:tetratricopeptide (TPR) repeat protein